MTTTAAQPDLEAGAASGAAASGWTGTPGEGGTGFRRGALALASAAEAAVVAIAEASLEGLDEPELGELLSEVAALESRVAAIKLEVLAEADARKVADAAAHTGTDAWAAALTGTVAGVMKGGIYLATMLRNKYHRTREAFADGGINLAQVRVIVTYGEKMPKAVTPEMFAVAEEELVIKAVNGLNPRRLRRAALRMLDKINTELADQHESDALDDERRDAERETFLSLHDNGDGTFSGKFRVSEMHGQLLKAYLEKLTSPRRLGRDKDGNLVNDPSIPTMAPGLNWSEALGQGFLELIEHLPTDGHGPSAVRLLVKIDLEKLRSQLGSAELDTGAVAHPGEARRLACNAQIIPAVLGGSSVPLDLGRARRLHSQPQRDALSLIFDTCAVAGCERPFNWCEVHHPDSWLDGGPTDLANAIPLCGFHHRRAHDDRYDIRYHSNSEIRFHEVRFRRRP